eukprot:g1850.t1
MPAVLLAARALSVAPQLLRILAICLFSTLVLGGPGDLSFQHEAQCKWIANDDAHRFDTNFGCSVPQPIFGVTPYNVEFVEPVVEVDGQALCKRRLKGALRERAKRHATAEVKPQGTGMCSSKGLSAACTAQSLAKSAQFYGFRALIVVQDNRKAKVKRQPKDRMKPFAVPLLFVDAKHSKTMANQLAAGSHMSIAGWNSMTKALTVF